MIIFEVYTPVAAILNDVALSTKALVYNPSFTGVLVGIVITSMSTALLLARDPLILLHVMHFGHVAAFKASAQKHESGVYVSSFLRFRELYFSVHTLVLISLLALICIAAVTLVVFYG
jgi:hypothetical protein